MSKILKHIEMDLDAASIKMAIKEVEYFQKRIEETCLELVQALTQEGVEIAKMQVISMDAVDTGDLEKSIHGTFMPTEGCGFVVADTPYAVYVEFGTGVVGAANPHPGIGDGASLGGVVSAGGKNGKTTHAHAGYARSFVADSNTGETKTTNSAMGWVYKDRNGEFHFTKGYPSRPFLYNTLKWLEEAAPDRASAKFDQM